MASLKTESTKPSEERFNPVSKPLLISDPVEGSDVWAKLNAVISIATSYGRPASPLTVSEYRRLLRRVLSHAEKSWSELTLADWQAYIRHRLATVKLNSASTDDKNIRAICNHTGNENEMCRALPNTRRIKYVPPNRRKLSEQEARSLLLITRQRLGYRAWVLISVMLHAGLRVSDITGARREDYRGGVLLLTVTKGKKPRVVHVGKALKRTLDGYVKTHNSAYLFGRTDGEQENRRYLHRIVRKAGAITGIEDLHPHMLRRSYGSIIHAKGAPLAFIQRQFGHSDIQTTMRYIDIDGSIAQEIADEYEF